MSFTSKPIEALNDSDKTELIDLQHRLEEIYKRKAEGAFVRSRKKWLEEGEQNSNTFSDFRNTNPTLTLFYN